MRVTFDRQPTLTGKLVALRPLRPEDYDPLFAVACDPLIWAQHPGAGASTPPAVSDLPGGFSQWTCCQSSRFPALRLSRPIRTLNVPGAKAGADVLSIN